MATQDVTGWWAENHEQFIVALSLALADTGAVRTGAADTITLTPAITALAQGYSGHSAATMTVGLNPAMSVAGVQPPQAGFSFDTTPAVAATASPNAGTSAGSFAVDATPAVGAATTMTGALDVDTTPAIIVGGAEHYSAATALGLTVASGMAGVERYAATLPLTLTPAVAASAVLHAPAGPSFDAVTSGENFAGASTSLSWTHTATAGSYILLPINVYPQSPPASLNAAITNVAYGGTAMTRLASIPAGNSWSSNGIGMLLYGLPNAPAGPKTIVITPSSGGTFGWATSLSYNNVNSVATQTAYGAGSTMTQTATLSAGQVGVCALGSSEYDAFTSAPSGGTSRFYNSQDPAALAAGLAVNDATATTTFSGSQGGADPWATILAILS